MPLLIEGGQVVSSYLLFKKDNGTRVELQHLRQGTTRSSQIAETLESLRRKLFAT